MIGMVCRDGRSTTTGRGRSERGSDWHVHGCYRSRDRARCHDPSLPSQPRDAYFFAADGRVAQRESTALTWQGPQVQSLSRPPSLPIRLALLSRQASSTRRASLIRSRPIAPIGRVPSRVPAQIRLEHAQYRRHDLGNDVRPGLREARRRHLQRHQTVVVDRRFAVGPAGFRIEQLATGEAPPFATQRHARHAGEEAQQSTRVTHQLGDLPCQHIRTESRSRLLALSCPVLSIVAHDTGEAARRHTPEIRSLGRRTVAQPSDFQEVGFSVAGDCIDGKARPYGAPVWWIEHVQCTAEHRLQFEHHAAQQFGKLGVFQHFRADQLETIGQRVVSARQMLRTRTERCQVKERGMRGRMPGLQPFREGRRRLAAFDRGLDHREQCLAILPHTAADQGRPFLRHFEAATARHRHPDVLTPGDHRMFADVIAAALDQPGLADQWAILANADRHDAMTRHADHRMAVADRGTQRRHLALHGRVEEGANNRGDLLHGAVRPERMIVFGGQGAFVKAEDDVATAVVRQCGDVARQLRAVFDMLQVPPAFVFDIERAARRIDQRLKVGWCRRRKYGTFGSSCWRRHVRVACGLHIMIGQRCK